MPSYVDFNASKHFRDFVLAKTLSVPNGPQTFNSSNYNVHSLSTYPNIDQGDVENNRGSELLKSQTINTYKPIDYLVTENLSMFTRRANLELYPYFVAQRHNIISIMSRKNYDDESELVKFAAWNINSNPEGPFFARLQSNLYKATAGRINLMDALEGDPVYAVNLITGKQPIIESNNSITVASTTLGKGIDFLQNVAGVEFPWTEIPGNYLTNPRSQIRNRREASTEAGRIIQDATGALGQIVGIQRRPTESRKPSDLFIEYMGPRQKSVLFDNLSYSTYAPDYTTTAMSQNTSKLFNMVDRFGQSVKTFLGVEAPKGIAYIGDDRGNDVKKVMTWDGSNDKLVRSNYYMVLMFDSVQATLFQRKRNIGEGGSPAGKLTWISSKSKNQVFSSENMVGITTADGESKKSYKRVQDNSKFSETQSKDHKFRGDSILGITQEILEEMPTDGGAARSHVANVIDQTSRIFREGDVMLSRGSAIKYIDQFTNAESGVEYCRVWTKDRSYLNYSDTMKKSDNYRKFESSVLNSPWNLNIYPNSNAKGEFDAGSTTMSRTEGGFFAKKYMFSIENLAWKTSDTPGFTYADLPYCERGSNGGRVMWFPPYDLKINEVNNAKWESNVFLGRPEPVYTYQNTERSGTVSFKVIVDHPSILNLLVKKHFEGMSDEAADNYINAFFAGCQDVDFYGLVRKYTTLTPDEVKAVMSYLNENKDSQPVIANKSVLPPPVSDKPVPVNKKESSSDVFNFWFENAWPMPWIGQYYYNPTLINSLASTARTVYSNLLGDLYSHSYYTAMYYEYNSKKTDLLNILNTGLSKLESGSWTADKVFDFKLLTGRDTKVNETPSDLSVVFDTIRSTFNDAFTMLSDDFNKYETATTELKSLLESNNVKEIVISVASSASAPDSSHNNLLLAYRRSNSVINDLLFRLAKTPDLAWDAMEVLEWTYKDEPNATETYQVEPRKEVSFKSLGYDIEGGIIIDKVINAGEERPLSSQTTEYTCSDTTNFIIPEFRLSAPNSFRCRNSQLILYYEKKDEESETQEPLTTQTPVSENILPEINGDSPSGKKLSPSIDEIKKLIMKTLSECYYFRKLEEDSPTQFSSLKEKLKYFHPSFHSMTPEGLNARLTFLHQCIRPGDTLPVKGMSDDSDINARNTTFGPPPVCILRIGDFYHSKIIIRDVNIDYDERIWDMNPEGIGVQPMIANVTLQINFIGGQGLEKPVERLQNALSSNFYANTEMYDPRSTSTEDRSKFYKKTFTKEFLDNLNQRSDITPKNNTKDMLTATDTVVQGNYIGAIENGNTSLNYTSLVNDLFYQTEAYSKRYEQAYNYVLTNYDLKIGSMLLSPTYRTIHDYDVQIGASTDTIEMLGKYPLRYELEVLTKNFRDLLINGVETENITTIFGFSNDMSSYAQTQSEILLKSYLRKTIKDVVDGMSNAVNYIKSVETTRNQIIATLDKLNYVVEYGHDGKINNAIYTQANFTGLTPSNFYSKYSNVISFIKNNHYKFTEDLDESYDFYSTTMSTNDFSYFLSVLLRDQKYKNEIVDLYRKDSKTFTNRMIRSIQNRLDRFMLPVKEEKNFEILTYPVKLNDNVISYVVTSQTIITNTSEIDNLINTHKTKGNETQNMLNYHRPAYGTSG